MAEIAPAATDPRRFSMRLSRPLCIGLASGVLIVIAVGLHIGMPVYRKQVAIREIERVGGFVSGPLGGPDWLRRLIGDDCMCLLRDDSTLVDLARSEDVSDDSLVWLSSFPALKSLNLRGTGITNAGMKHIRGLKTLKHLDIGHTWVTDAGIGELKGLKNLRWLSVDGSRVSDAGVARLKGDVPDLHVEK
jgi:hypothetical protein